MRRPRFSPKAQSDLDSIWNYSAENWGLDRAEAYIRQIQGACEALYADPRLGRRCDDIRPDYLKIASGSHVLFYREQSEVIEIVRILYETMDFERHF
jgi:toxin ParE1/3/4